MTNLPASPRRMALLTEGNSDPLSGKTAAGLLRYCPDEVVAVIDSQRAGGTAGPLFDAGGDIPIVGSIEQVPDADWLVIGISPSGGKLPEPWRPILLAAIGRGMHLMAGLHFFLSDDLELKSAADQAGVRIVDLRKNSFREVATGQPFRSGCLRLHTVGHDCSVGKMVVALSLAQALRAAGRDAVFAATGQTGMAIARSGYPIDCIVSDFVNGAAEQLVRENEHHEIVIVEGQGSLAHPKYSAVTTGILHGCRPHGMIMCYEAGRTATRAMAQVPLRPLPELITLYESMAKLVHPSQVIGIAANTRLLNAASAKAECDRVSQTLQLPVCDVIRDGCGPLIEATHKLAGWDSSLSNSCQGVRPPVHPIANGKNRESE